MSRRLTWLALGMLSAGFAVGSRAAEPAAPAYEDRVLDSAPQAQIDESAEQAPATGWPRGGSVELQTQRQRALTEQRNQTLQFTGFLDTPNYGAFSADLSLNRYRNTVTAFDISGQNGNLYNLSYLSGNTGRIDQRAMPFNNGWYAHNSIGDINTAATQLSRGLGRMSLPSLPIEGFATTFEKPGRTSLNASSGRLGFFDGINSQGFTTGRGTATTFGGQQQIAGDDSPLGIGRTDMAFQWVDARNVNLNSITGYAQDTTSFWGATSWQGVAPWADSIGAGIGPLTERPGGLRVQANYAHSTGKPSDLGSLAPHDSANGFWVDADWRSDWARQGASAFYFDPALRWGSNPIAGDLQGASWRADVSTRQWQLGGNVELSESVSGQQGRSLFGNLFGRYRFDSRDAISSTVAARTGTQAAQSLQVTWEHISPTWGQSQWRTDLAHGRDQQVVRLGLDQAWAMPESSSFSTTLAFEQSELFGATARSVIWGALGSLPFLASGRLDLSVRGSNGMGSNSSRFLNANARVSWALGAGWSFYVQYSASNGQESLNPAVVSALTAATQQPIFVLPSSRTLLFAVRYEARAGTATAPIGGGPGVGSGRLEGHVFLDQNSNGLREANEGGVPGVTVVLNGRFVARTDAQGFYSFPSVAAGNHEIELVPDNLPLPWSNPGPATRRVDVFVRDTATADFAIQRDR
ncbi:SdrD B-like domain-containing protein [Variovorax sp. J2P1-59]|uniref:SdrD B-like domain-containing protein n=1 Tax=Variovorax flavidus TaxID=3053501 RepID=UPI002577D6CF|nr:SdrD B-like domain-containing protein [Variovorax sp. J2P1-59]MDM0076224.1 SdrD B-like domain-containing protein [Variovorax sp. J2P1-59]